MKLSRLAKAAIALAVTLVVFLVVITYGLPTWREIITAFGFIGMAATIGIPIYIYIRLHSKEWRGWRTRMKDYEYTLRDLKDDLPEYKDTIDTIIDGIRETVNRAFPSEYL